MVSGLFHIKINSDDNNKDNGFYTLMTSGTSIICLEDEEYVVPEEAISKLNDKEITYEMVIESDKKKECETNAAETKI